jgi:hypothetical protein
VVTRLTSSASLLGSAFSATLLVPGGLKHGLYGGTALLVAVIILFQLLGFIAAVGIPALVLLFRRRFQLSQVALWLLGFGLFGVALEALALFVIPPGSNC